MGTRRNELINLISVHRTAIAEETLTENMSPHRYWGELFYLYFLNHENISYLNSQLKKKKEDSEEDDLLWFVRAKETTEEGDDAVFVVRKHSSQIPALGTCTVNWEETLYLNCIMHHFEYRLAMATCVKKDEHSKLEILNKVTRRVYATPSKRRMDTKEGETSITYPFIYFAVDDFEECFTGMSAVEGQQICIQLSAHELNTDHRIILFQGGVQYNQLLDLFSFSKSGVGAIISPKKCEFLTMNGPRGKGSAQLAVGMQEIESLWKRLTSPSKPTLNVFLTEVVLTLDSILNDLLWK